MKKIISILAAAACLSLIVSCEKTGTESGSVNDAAFESVAKTFISNTLAPTYTSLASESDELVSEITTLAGARTQANLNKVCKTFLQARMHWELSEAFLYGAATVCGIDPHIDNWPLDEDGYKSLMNSPKMLANLEGEDGAIWAGENLGNGLLGFHAMEYILFEDGSPKNVSKIDDDQYIYLAAVAGDLRNHTVQLEVAWLGDDAPAAHVELMEDLEYEVTCDGSGFTYSENLLKAGKAGSSIPSWTGAMQYMIDGASAIADEVGSSKIGKPYSPQEAGDENYIESPYSWNSITDFYDNITSIANMYYGGIEGNRNETNSLHAWMSKNHADVDKTVTTAISNALLQIGKGKDDTGEGMVYPFVNNIKNPATLEAIEACSELVSALGLAKEAVKD